MWTPWDDIKISKRQTSLSSEERELARKEYRTEVLDMMSHLGEDLQDEKLVMGYVDAPGDLITRFCAHMSEMAKQARFGLLGDSLNRTREEAKYRASRRSLER